MDKYAVMEDTLNGHVKRLFKKLRRIDAEKRALEEEVDRAAERERELVEALQTYRDAVIYLNERCRPDVPGTMLLGFQKLFAAVEQGDALAKPKAERGDD